MEKTRLPEGPGRTIRQDRSRRTYRSLLAAGFALLETSEFEAITIAAIAKQAGYSVGAFYARFRNKDEFFDAMLAEHIRERSEARRKLLDDTSHDRLVDDLIEDLVGYYWKRRGFWRAVLMRSAHDPEFFAPIRESSREFVDLLTKRLQTDANRRLSKTERANIRFAAHMVLGMVNNRIVNRPQPSLIGHSTFVANLSRAFRLVSGFDALGA